MAVADARCKLTTVHPPIVLRRNTRSVAGALDGALQKAGRLSVRAGHGDVYVLVAAAQAAQAHEVDEHAGPLQGGAVADPGDPGVFDRWLEEDHFLNLSLAWEQRDQTLSQVTSRGAFQLLENILAATSRRTRHDRLWQAESSSQPARISLARGSHPLGVASSPNAAGRYCNHGNGRI